MPVAPRQFTVGDHVHLVPGAYSVNNPQDEYTISRMLPVQEDVWQYRVKRVSDGQERAVHELQVVKVTIFAARGRAANLTALTSMATRRSKKHRGQWRLADAVASHAREAVRLIADPADSPSKLGAVVMPLETRRLYSSANGDRWYLARDTEAGHVFIRHEPNVSSGGRPSNIEIREFLVRGGSGPEHQELLRLIGTLVEDPSQLKG